jgi:hypothetical protein
VPKIRLPDTMTLISYFYPTTVASRYLALHVLAREREEEEVGGGRGDRPRRRVIALRVVDAFI